MCWLALVLLIPYIYIILKIFSNLLKIKPYSSSGYASTFVTILIAARNEETNLPTLLYDISLQDYSPHLFEVIVIDDNSTDNTYFVAEGYKRIRELKVIRNPLKGKKGAIRTGAGLAAGNLIITVDADCRINRSWLSTIASFYEKEKPGMIICPVALKGGSSFFHRFQELEFLSLQGVTAGSAVAGDPVMCNGANLSFIKESYNRHSAYLHEDLISGDDIFLLHNMKKDKRETILWIESVAAIATSGTSLSLKSFMIQRARWLSKAGAYKDLATKGLAIVTIIAVFVQLSSLIAGIIETNYLVLFATVFLLKSVPDYLTLWNTTTRYRKRSLMKWFPVAQFIYPFYVLAVIAFLLSGKGGNR